MSVIRRRIAALLSLTALALLTVGCGGVREQTQAWREPPHGSSTSAGDLLIRNVVVVTDSEGNGTLYASFANEGDEPDALTGVVIGENEANLDGDIELPVGRVTSVSPDHERIDVSGLDVEPGFIVDVRLIFANAPRATTETIVQQNEGRYAHVEFG